MFFSVAFQFLSMTARGRTERSLVQHSLKPHLYSVLIYSRLESININIQNKDYQLSSRILVLANSLQAIDHQEGSFLAMCAVLLTEAMAGSALTHMELFDHLLSKTNNVLMHEKTTPGISNLSVSVCRRLSSLLLQSNIFESHDATADSLNRAVSPSELLLTKTFDLMSCQRQISQHSLFFLEQAVSLMIPECQTRFIVTFVEVLQKFGQSIQQSSDNPELQRFTIENYRHLIGSIDRMVASTKIELSLSYRGLVYIIAATSLLPIAAFSSPNKMNRKYAADRVLFDEAMRLFQGGVSLFESFNTSTNHKSCLNLLDASIHVTIQSMNVVLLDIVGSQEEISNHISQIVNACSVLADRIVSLSTEEPDEVLQCIKRIMTGTLIRTQDWLEERGEKTSAMVLGLWARDLQKEDELAHLWFSSSIMTSSFDGNTTITTSCRPSTSYAAKKESVQQALGSQEWIFQTEYQLCRIRLGLLHPTQGSELSFDFTTKELEAIRIEIESRSKIQGERFSILFLWLESTLLLVHSDVSAFFGCYPAALRSSQRCLEKCKAIMKQSGSNAATESDWLIAAASSTVLCRSAHRYVQVLSRRPKLYYRMGDHRKAMAYMQAVFDFLKIDSQTTTGSEEKPETIFHNLLHIMQNAPLSSKHYSRLYLEIKSWASTPDLTYKELSRLSPEHLVRSNANGLSTQSIEIFQESIRDLISGKSLFGLLVN
jgi:hypothetical protein